MASLFEAIVLQNLSVLTRGHTLRPHVLLLGGPNRFIRGMREAWQANIPRMWKERKVEVPEGAKPEDLIKVPNNAQILRRARRGRIRQERRRLRGVLPRLRKAGPLHRFRAPGGKAKSGAKGLVAKDGELDVFKEAYRRKKVYAGDVPAKARLSAALSALTADRLRPRPCCSTTRRHSCKAYQLSNGNPIQDTIDMFENLRGQVEAQNAKLEVLGVATTGYAKDILKDVLHADVALVETVAHTESALKFYDDPHVIVDVGGQDIKIIILHNGRVKDFKLNTQCSAGNGYFLQSTAEGFGLKVEQYADLAFSASRCRCSVMAARSSCSRTL